MRDGSVLAVGKGNPEWNYSAPHGVAIPSIDNLVALAVILGVTIDEIIVIDGVARAKISA